jgi:DNA-binding CsgD family transcriptional regulator
MRDATAGHEDRLAGGGASPTLAAATQLARTTLRVGFALMLAAVVTDWVFAAIAGAGAVTMVEGAALAAVAVAGLRHPARAHRVLSRRGMVLVPAAVFALVGAVDFGLQVHYVEVPPAIVWIAVIVAAPRWFMLCVAVSAVGYVGDLALQGHSVAWLTSGVGENLISNQAVDLVANAGALWLLMLALRTFLAGAPTSVVSVRDGARSLTPQLALAVAQPRALLDRADPRAVTSGLSGAEWRVVALLAQGRAPKQIALESSLALATVRSHIANAKRKTGARTVEQLAALLVESLE